MSKTVSTCLFETNQIPNKPQENVFFHSLYRTETEFADEFFRTAKSTSPIQICAIFSTQGPDTLAASLNIVLNKELTNIVAEAQKQPVLDFEAFSNKVVNNLNIRVCNYIVSKGGTPLRTSMTMFILDGDVLRVLHIGNTKAVLFRDNKIMALTEEHTVAHRYVQMNAITPEQEKTHPEKETLTQYLGKMPQDGPVKPDKKVNLKLKDGDELFLMGIGISRAIPSQMRNMIIAKPMSTEEKAREIIVSAFNYGVKYGLSILSMKIESTFLLPGDAVIAASAASSGEISVKEDKKEDSDFEAFDDPFDDKSDSDISQPDSETMTFDRSNVSEDSEDNGGEEDIKFNARKKKRKSIILEILIYIIILIVFAGIAFGALLLIFKNKNIISDGEETEPTITQEIFIMYVIEDNVSVLYEPNPDSVQIGLLHAGDQIDVLEIGDEYSQVDTGNVIGYVLNSQITSNINDVIVETEAVETTEATIIITATPTPRPTSSTNNGGIVVATTAGNNGTPATTAATTAAITAATTAVTTAATAETTETTIATDSTETTASTDSTTTTETPTESTTAPTESTAAPTEATTAAPVETAAPAPAEGDPA